MDPRWLIAVAVYIAVDILYIVLSRDVYAAVATRVQGGTRGLPSGRIGAAAVAYTIMAGCWLLLLVPWMQRFRSRGPAWAVGAAAGALYGVALYGVFNFTNAALFEDWSGSVIARDMAWGVTWCSVVSAAAAAWLL